MSASGLSESGVNLGAVLSDVSTQGFRGGHERWHVGKLLQPRHGYPIAEPERAWLDRQDHRHHFFEHGWLQHHGEQQRWADRVRVSRTTTATLQVTGRYIVQYAMASNDVFTIPMSIGTMTISGNVRCDGGLGGNTSAITNATTIIPTNTAKPAFPSSSRRRRSAQLDLCKALPTYKTSDTADLLGSATVTASTNLVTSKTNNPGNVWYYTAGDLTMTGTITLNGTLVVANGKNLIIGGAVTINPKTGYPGLIVADNIEFSGSARKLTVNGITWVGQNLTGTGTLPQGTLTVNGSLMWGGSSPKFDTTKLLSPASKIIVTWPDWRLDDGPTHAGCGVLPRSDRYRSDAQEHQVRLDQLVLSECSERNEL